MLLIPSTFTYSKTRAHAAPTFDDANISIQHSHRRLLSACQTPWLLYLITFLSYFLFRLLGHFLPRHTSTAHDFCHQLSTWASSARKLFPVRKVQLTPNPSLKMTIRAKAISLDSMVQQRQQSWGTWTHSHPHKLLQKDNGYYCSFRASIQSR